MLLITILALASVVRTDDLPASCVRPVYCDSELLHHVQLARIFPDSKTFVDLQLRNDENKTLELFNELLEQTNRNPSKEQIQNFVDQNFESGNELEIWKPTDYSDNPAFLNEIRDETLRNFGRDIYNIWPTLGRKVKPVVFEKPHLYSFIPITNGFIIPGGRFSEIYYWDAYWIIEGLLISGMEQTARGMIENLIQLLKKLGHIPNGSRCYYEQRSQPPLLSAMVWLYVQKTKDIDFLKANMQALEDEIEYWQKTQLVTFDKGGKSYTLLQYNAASNGPRPESYYEDYTMAQQFESEDRRREFYIELKSAAESGWDFSSRWFIGPNGENTGNLSSIHTRDIIPVDLNAIFANALHNAAYFQGLLKNVRRAAHWGYLAKQWRRTMDEVLWDEVDGIWYDYNLKNGEYRKYFYPSNVSPLWMKAVDRNLLKKRVPRIIKYLRDSGALDFPGGIPTSLIKSGEQWDYPNAWPPLVSIVVNSLKALGTSESKQMAFDVAQTWVRACLKGFTDNKQMFEKYDVEQPGRIGGGGEYIVQTGFGWSNGVVLEMLKAYGNKMTAVDSNNTKQADVTVDESMILDDSVLEIPVELDENTPKMLTLRMFNLRLYPVLGLLGACANAFTVVPICNSSIYCSGDLLHRVQLARIFPDSKTFVDLKLVYPENETLADYAKLIHDSDHNPSWDQINNFVKQHFLEGNELEYWMPPDFDPDPPILKRIIDPKLKSFAKNVIGKWAKLGRKVNPDVVQNPGQYSFIYVPNGFIVPGGRFKELYYWDSYWVIRGLLLSNMTETARGMIENLFHLVEKLGYIPNGNRIYYLGRSQPPLLAAMVASYIAATGDLGWLEQHIGTVEKELQYWLNNKKVTVEVDKKKYVLLRYLSDANFKGPRPESYFEDYTNARILPNEDKREDFYAEMKSAAESGWDFSSRWFVTAEDDVMGNITDVHASRIIPVDLNAIFAGALQHVGDFRSKLKDRREAQKWWSLANYWRRAIQQVMWDSGDGVWYDYDSLANTKRRHFYPSCATPLWTKAVEDFDAPKYASHLVRYLLSSGALDFPGGIPASILNSGEQWDYPNAWPPTQSILIGGLDRSGDEEAQNLAKEQATLWISANYIGYNTWKKMFEKYSAVQPGHHGSGGEYIVQDGFGWTNGVLLELLDRYGKELTIKDHFQISLPYVRQIS
ncbi:uncharacterized protein [Battus philenor]|uniref:uncharacterized protein n=1 Tax=Battus philenor TaxID=42288 RepID=UPI0035CEA235